MEKTFRTHTTLALLGAAIFFFSGCKKDGATGPQGPQGPVGQTNVTAATFSVSSWAFTAPYYYQNFSMPELTTKNIDSALVMVYFKTIGSNWFALPYTQYDSPYNYYMGFVCNVGNVQVTWFYDSSLSSGKDPNTYYSTVVKYKVVVIPPSMKQKGVNVNNYEEVRGAYSLKD
jgi:hypothetical protein